MVGQITAVTKPLIRAGVDGLALGTRDRLKVFSLGYRAKDDIGSDSCHRVSRCSSAPLDTAGHTSHLQDGDGQGWSQAAARDGTGCGTAAYSHLQGAPGRRGRPRRRRVGSDRLAYVDYVSREITFDVATGIMRFIYN